MIEGLPKIDSELKETQYIERIPVVLKKPDDPIIVEKLEKKLREYETRMSGYKGQMKEDEEKNGVKNITLEGKYLDSLYKFIVLGNLLHDGEVDENKIRVVLSDMYNGVNLEKLGNAFDVVNSYVNGGRTYGGTGI